MSTKSSWITWTRCVHHDSVWRDEVERQGSYGQSRMNCFLPPSWVILLDLPAKHWSDGGSRGQVLLNAIVLVLSFGTSIMTRNVLATCFICVRGRRKLTNKSRKHDLQCSKTGPRIPGPCLYLIHCQCLHRCYRRTRPRWNSLTATVNRHELVVAVLEVRLLAKCELDGNAASHRRGSKRNDGNNRRGKLHFEELQRW